MIAPRESGQISSGCLIARWSVIVHPLKGMYYSALGMRTSPMGFIGRV